ncbi:MAG: L-rhamnose mutarotase [Candidatus Marinimicrobia bacterium]|nr:L-rhamnose mutarotase [Candidatus Neomarinimicrobiota bacterium]
MIRKAFRMTVHEDKFDEYRQRHNPIWQEMESTLKSHAVHNYSIFLDESDGSLFGYVEIEDEAQWNAIAETDICQKWWRYMSDIMPTNPDDSPKSRDLQEVFHLD